MAENRNITWNVALVIKSDISSPFSFYLKDAKLEWGKWRVNPPSDVIASEAGKTYKFQFIAEGTSCTAEGTEGKVIYESDDNSSEPTTIEFYFDVPFTKANKGNVYITGGASNGNYSINNGGGVPKTGNEPVIEVSITQVKPVV